MPPKKKPAQQPSEEAKSEISEIATSNTIFSIAAFEEMLDKRLKIHMKELDNAVSKHYKATHDELKAIQSSQDFISNKFDELLNSFSLLKEENSHLKLENAQLNILAKEMADRISKLEEDQENINLYSRRDCLEFHGVPETPDEITDELVKQIGDLMAVEVKPSDISTSHRLPSKRGVIPTIIAKFARRSIRDKLYESKGKLKNRSSADLGFARPDNKLYVNESLTPKARELYYQVRQVRKSQRFKYAWTKYGKSYLKKDDTSRVTSFASIKELDDFKANMSTSFG